MLYQKQLECANKLAKAFEMPNHISDRHLYLSGEMGVGKTYIASYTAHLLNSKRTLIIAPSAVVKKWQTVYQEFNDVKPVIINHRNIEKVWNENKGINFPCIVSENEANQTLKMIYCQLSKQCTEETYDYAMSIYQKWGTHVLNNALPATNLAIDNPIFDFVIFDELHTYRSTRKIFGVFALLILQNIKTLGLTGTIFNQNLSYLGSLLYLSNFKLMKMMALSFGDRANGLVNYLSSPYIFLHYIWHKIAVHINLSDVQKERTTDDVNQTIMPLKGIELTNVQEAWLNLAELNMRNLGFNKKRIDKLTTSYLDLPTSEPMIIKRFKKIDNNHSQIINNLISLGLRPIKLSETTKFLQLKNILKEKQKTVVFVQDKRLLKELPLNLEKTFSVPSSVIKTDIADYVNERLSTDDCDTAILTTSQVSVGIDLNSATRIIWYQVPFDVATILQAQRRVLRLNSTKSSQVYYLFYKGTSQEEIIEQVSNSAIQNAASYNVRDNSNLAKATQVLFEGIE